MGRGDRNSWFRSGRVRRVPDSVSAPSNRQTGRPRAAALAVASCGIAILLAGLANPGSARAQTPGILAPGNAIVTGFSGAPPPAQIAPGQDPGDLTFIDPKGPSAKVFNLQSPGAPPQAQVIPAPNPFTVTAAQVGQVFGVALDNATPPNMYVAASSAYGLPIVVPGPNGAPTRLHQGAPGATFMAGLFGPAALGGGPGSIWRIDGVTGAVTLFSNVMFNGAANSGPALGGVAFDPGSKTIITADRQTGMIQSYNLSGAQVGSYDHGVKGLGAAGQTPVPYTPSALDITNPAFSSDNPATWDYAPPQRLVFGLGVQGGRLYYGVAASLQVWSVSINTDGTFGADARVEVQVPPAQGPTEISKIIFDGDGDMILAERGTPTGDYELTAVAQPAIAPVLRYSPVPGSPPTWQPVPDQYAIGFPGQFTNANGGVAIGYNYKVNGNLDFGSCGGFLWSTGEQLRNSADPNIAAQLAATGVLDLSGLQGNALSLVMPANVPPVATYFVDYAPQLDDPAVAGYMGDIAIPINCSRAAFQPLPSWGFRHAGYCPPYRMTPFGQCCPPWQEVDHGQCMCPGGLQPGPGGQCSCLAGFAQQPGYLCCPLGELPGGGGCQSVCPQGQSDPLSEALCAYGYSPVANSSGQLVCRDGSSPNPPQPFPPPGSGGGFSVTACITQSVYTNAANCPASWTLQPLPGVPGAMVCQPPPQCSNVVGGGGSQLGPGGTCQNLCPSGGFGYPTTQCCPNGATPGPDGSCPTPPPPPNNCTPGTTHYCTPLTGKVLCKVGNGVPAGCCPDESSPDHGFCVTTGSSCGPGSEPLCCPANAAPNFNTNPPSCCKPGEIVLLGGSCGTPRTPPSCSPDETVYCKPAAPPVGATCATGQKLPNGSCCPTGTKVAGGACVAIGKSCPAGDEQRCCTRDETPNYIKGGCCPRDTAPNSDGVCKTLALVPTLPPAVTTCAPRYALSADGKTCVFVNTTTPTTPTPGTPVLVESCNGGSFVSGVCTCPGDAKPVNGNCPAVPSGGTTIGTPVLVESCNGGSFVGGVCTCPGNAKPVNGNCPAVPSGGTIKAVPVEVESCTGGSMVNGVCKCPGNDLPRNGSCTGGTTTTAPTTCGANERLEGTKCVSTLPPAGSTLKLNTPPKTNTVTPPKTNTVTPPKVNTITSPKINLNTTTKNSNTKTILKPTVPNTTTKPTGSKENIR